MVWAKAQDRVQDKLDEEPRVELAFDSLYPRTEYDILVKGIKRMLVERVVPLAVCCTERTVATVHMRAVGATLRYPGVGVDRRSVRYRTDVGNLKLLGTNTKSVEVPTSKTRKGRGVPPVRIRD